MNNTTNVNEDTTSKSDKGKRLNDLICHIQNEIKHTNNLGKKDEYAEILLYLLELQIIRNRLIAFLEAIKSDYM